MNKPSQKTRIATRGTLLIALGATVVASVLAGIISGFAAAAGAASAVIAAVTVAVLLAVTFLIGIWWWAHLDEAAQEAHKWAWWWGGTAGLAVGGVAAAVLINPGTDGILSVALGALDPAAAFRLGLIGILLCQVVGYGIAWAAWWLRRR